MIEKIIFVITLTCLSMFGFRGILLAYSLF